MICRSYSRVNAFWHTYRKFVYPRSFYRKMVSVSQNLPRTFYKLADKWDKKVGSRNFESKCWTLSSSDTREPIHKVACLMSEMLGKEPTGLPQRLSQLSVECQWTSNQQVWIYDMRQSDSLPKTQTDTQRLYGFVEALLKNWFNGEDRDYLLKHVHIATCFFVWYLTKPNFFYKDQVMKQTTRNGIQRVWTPLLLDKKLKPKKEPANTSAPKSQFTTTTDALLPKQQQQQAKLKKDIETLIAATTLENASLEWEDPHRLHLKISECMTNSNLGLSIKQNKKLQKIYNDYTTVTTKINKTMEKITKIERANAKLAPKLEPAWDDELGPPPNSPPELIRQSACELVSECWGCETSQPNQMAHMGGCLPDELEAGEAEEEVPDSWEDL